MTRIEAEDDAKEIVELKDAREVLKGQVKSLELHIEENKTKFDNELETLKATKESFEAALRQRIK